MRSGSMRSDNPMSDESISADLAIRPFFHDATGTWSYVVSRGCDAVVIDPVLDYDQHSGHVATDSVRELLAYVLERDLQVHRILETHAHPLPRAAFRARSRPPPVPIGPAIRSVQAHFADIFALTSDDPALTEAF